MKTKEDILNEQKDRLNKVYNELVYRKIIERKKDFASLFGKGNSNMVQALKGNPSYLTESFIREICSVKEGKVTIDLNWLYSGTGDVMFHIWNDDGSYDVVKVDKSSADDHELIVLYRENRELLNENRRLNGKIKRLEIELDNLKKSQSPQLGGTSDASTAQEEAV